MIKDYTVWKHMVNIVISFDCFCNSIIGGNPRETISSRAGRWIKTNSHIKGGIWYWLCRGLHMIDKNHCLDAIDPQYENKIYRVWK